MEKADMPIILLSGHLGVFTELQRRRTQDAFSNVRIASPSEKNVPSVSWNVKAADPEICQPCSRENGNRSFNRKSNDLYSGIAGYRCCKISGFSAGLWQVCCRKNDDVISEVAMEWEWLPPIVLRHWQAGLHQTAAFCPRTLLL